MLLQAGSRQNLIYTDLYGMTKMYRLKIMATGVGMQNAVKVDDEFLYIHIPKKNSKNRRSSRLPLPAVCIYALKQLPGYGIDGLALVYAVRRF
jgi:hypothetical protein